MALFVIVLAPSLTHVTYRPVRTILVSVSIPIPIIILLLIGLTRLGYIDSNGRGGAFLLSLPLIISAAVFLLIAPGFCGGLRVARALRSCQRFGALGLKFFHPGVLYRLALAVALAVGLGRGGVGRPRAS